MATAAGNTFVLKPSEKDPGCSMLLAELAMQAGEWLWVSGWAGVSCGVVLVGWVGVSRGEVVRGWVGVNVVAG